MSNKSAVHQAVRFALLAGAGAALAMPAVFAQDTAQSAQTDNQAQSTSSTTAVPTQLGKIEVTGTRIKRSSTETAQPITIITAQQIRASGLTTIGQVLANITQAGDSFSLSEQQLSIGSGSETINLRYLGSTRVLVLVNGRRWTEGIGGSVDLSAIPASVIDHVEILQDGASAIYGSDAIAGVVNIITVHNFNGADAHAYTGMYDNDYDGVRGWDGKKQEYDFTIGTSNDKSGVVMSLSYTDTDPIWQANRAQSIKPVFSTAYGVQPLQSNYVGETTITSPTLAGQQIGNAQCNSSGTCDMQLINTPNPNPSLSNFTNYQTSIFTANQNNILSAAQEVDNIFLKAHYDLAKNVTFTTMAAYTQMHGQQWIGTDGLGYGASPYYGADGVNLGVGKNNPYNPFGVDLVGNESQYCPTGTNSAGASCTPNYLLDFLGFAPMPTNRHYDSRIGTSTIRMGLNGFFDAIGSEWDWDLGYSYGHIIDDEDGQGVFDDVRVAQQLDSPGFPQCNGPAQSSPGATGNWQEINGQYYQILVPGCVPMNPWNGFNTATNTGGLTPAMLEYSEMTELWQNRVNSRDYSANITGTLANLPAGPVGVAVGAEYLEDDGVEQPGADISEGNVADVAFKLTQGRIWTHAEYFEVNVPLLSDVPMARSLSVDFANRWSQFKWVGGTQGTLLAGETQRANSTTAQAKLRWQPTTDLLLRGSWSQGFRVPDLSDLYAGQGFAFSSMEDPCAPASEGGAWTPGTPLPAGCNGDVHTQRTDQIRVALGGNPGLRPEKAISRSAGFVYSPNWFPGFNFSADYYKIEIDNTIGTAGSQFILDQCYVSQDPTYCAKIQFAANTITLVNDTNLNVGSTYTNGIDVSAGYSFPSTAIGDFRLSSSWTFLRSFVNVEPSAASTTGFVSIQNQGFDGFPTSKGTLGLNWNLGEWSASWNLQYLGSQFASCNAVSIQTNRCTEPTAIYEPTGTTGKTRMGTTIYNDAEVTYHITPANTDFTFGIRNLFNKQPPIQVFYNDNFGLGYRIPGRFVYARVGVKF